MPEPCSARAQAFAERNTDLHAPAGREHGICKFKGVPPNARSPTLPGPNGTRKPPALCLVSPPFVCCRSFASTLDVMTAEPEEHLHQARTQRPSTASSRSRLPSVAQCVLTRVSVCLPQTVF